jgi:hypothetical protein
VSVTERTTVAAAPTVSAVLYDSLFDDAAAFPPAVVPMPQAVDGYRAQAHSRHAWLMGNFVCPAPRLAELTEALRAPRPSEAATGTPRSADRHATGDLDLAVTLPDGVADLCGAIAFLEMHPQLRLRALELPTEADRLPEVIEQIRLLVPPAVPVYLELPPGQLDAERCAEIASAGCFIKLRTGGVTAEAFPSVADLSQALRSAVRSGAPFKCTAGLHHAVAQRDHETGFEHHGFLNMLLTVHALQARSGDASDLLSSTDQAELTRRASSLSAADAAQLRSQFRRIGSCSLDEPLSDLVALGLID